MSQALSFICSRCLRSSQSLALPLPRGITTLATAQPHSNISITRRIRHTNASQRNRRHNATQSRTYSTEPQRYTPLTTTTFPNPPPTTTSSISSATPPTISSPSPPLQTESQSQPPSSSAPAAATATTAPILNPRTADDGTPLLMTITPRAANRLSQLMKMDANPHLALRITVESGGCHGFQYSMSIASNSSAIDLEEDTLFIYSSSIASGSESSTADSKGKQEAVKQAEGLPKVVMDLPSLELLEGSKIDYVMELIGSQFKIVDNPRATSSCGCGTSFDVQM